MSKNLTNTDNISDKNNESIDSKLNKEIDFEEGFKNNPLEYSKLCLNSDYYSITWTALRKMQFIGIKYNGVDIYLIPSDYFWIYINFISFSILMLITIFLLVKEALVDDIYKNSGYLMYILRIFLVMLAQRKLLPEFNQGYCKLLYALQNKREFTHPSFACFVAICQMFVVCTNLLAIIFYICMADQFIEPITNFSGLCILSELDDWIGESIMSYNLKGFQLPETDQKYARYLENEFVFEMNPHEHKFEIQKVTHVDTADNENVAEKEEKMLFKKNYDMKLINERMSLIAKLATISESDLEIEIDDKIELNTHWTILYLEKLTKYIPWNVIIPLITIPISYFLPSISKFFRQYLDN